MTLVSWSMQRIGIGKRLIICNNIITNGHFAIQAAFLDDSVRLPPEIKMLIDLGGNFIKQYNDKWEPLKGDEYEALSKSIDEIFVMSPGAIEVTSTNLRYKEKYDKTEVTVLYAADGSLVVAQSLYNDPLMRRLGMKCFWDESRTMFIYFHEGEKVGVVAGMGRGTTEALDREFSSVFTRRSNVQAQQG